MGADWALNGDSGARGMQLAWSQIKGEGAAASSSRPATQ